MKEESGKRFKFAIVTPSHAPDYERCRMLVKSVRKFISGNVTHYIIVNKKDKKLFKTLEGGNIEIVSEELILPWWLKRLPCRISGKNVWLNFKGAPVRGWIIQQLIKLASAQIIPANIFIFVDSDVSFIKPVDFQQYFMRDDKVRLFRKYGGSDKRWDNSTSKLLGLPLGNCSNVSYVGPVIAWRRDNLLALCDYLQENSNKNWIEIIASTWHVSEYSLYGHFVDNIIGDNNGHYHDENPYCHQHDWVDGNKPSSLSKEQISDFFSTIGSEDIAIMISSAAGIPAKKYEHYINDILSRREVSNHHKIT